MQATSAAPKAMIAFPRTIAKLMLVKVCGVMMSPR
jgi:hypothetical protein